MKASELIERYNNGERDFEGAHLELAYLEGAYLDFSVWPLWCGSFDINVDMELVYQLALHICKLKNDSAEFKKIKKFLTPYANKFHQVVDGNVQPVVVDKK